MLQQNR